MGEVKATINSRLSSIDLSPSLMTPNYLLTMKTRVLSPPGVFPSADKFCRKRLRRVQQLANEFWTRWRKEYLLSLQQLRETYVWMTSVIIKDDNAPRNRWQLARIVTAN